MKITLIELNLQCSMVTHHQQIVQHVSWSQGCCSTSLYISKPILQTFTPGVNHTWHYVNNWMCQSREYIEDKSMHQVALASIHALTIVWTFITVSSKIFSLIIILIYILYIIVPNTHFSHIPYLRSLWDIYIVLCR